MHSEWKARRSVVAVFVSILAVSSTAIGLAINYFNEGCQNFTAKESPTVPEPPVRWDEQALVGIPVYETYLSTNVSISGPSDRFGYGPAFLLNGLLNSGYWYQVGVTYNWGGAGRISGHVDGYSLVTAVFAPGAAPTDPTFESLVPAQIRPGVPVGMSLDVVVTCVVMSWTVGTQQLGTLTYAAYGGTEFVNGSAGTGLTGFQTSLMTEWWHVDPYSGPTANASYTVPHLAGSYLGLAVDEWNPHNGEVPANWIPSSKLAKLGCECTTTLVDENVTESVNATTFNTG